MSDKDSGNKQAWVATIAVAIITAIGGVMVALINNPPRTSQTQTPSSAASPSNPTIVPTSPLASPSPAPSSESQNLPIPGDKNNADHANCSNIKVSGGTVTIICSPASNGIDLPKLGPGGFPQGNNATSTPVKLQASVKSLQRGSNHFTLWLTNATPDRSVDIPTLDLAISDDQGNTYELDRWTDDSIGLSKVVPPNGRIKLDYTLVKTIAQKASTVNFTINNVWAQPVSSQFKQPLPPVQWATKL
jgi:hypothetical protein